MHLQGEFAIKLGYFLCQQKAKNSRNLKANILWAVCHFCRTVFAATAYGMRLMYLYFVGLEVGDGCEKMLEKKEQQPFSPPVSCTECEQEKPLFVSVFQKRIDFQ